MADEQLWAQRLHADDRERVLAADDERFETNGKPFSVEYYLSARDG